MGVGSIREGIGQGLKEAADTNPLIIGLAADLTESTRMNIFAEAHPERFVQVGVAEQNLIGVAAGFALAGKVPVAASYAVFSPGRTWDQLRVSVCYSNLNVKLIGGHAGLTVGPDGATHQALEDIAITRVLPNLTVVVPCDQEEARKAMIAMTKNSGPAYIRSSREKSPNITSQNTAFELGKALTLKQGSDITLIACGLMVAKALAAAETLELQGISTRVINLHTIKPLDTETILAAARETKAIITAEEHQLAGGLGSTVAEFLAQHHPKPIGMVGMSDQFGESGTSDQLLTKYQLTSEAIVTKATHILTHLS